MPNAPYGLNILGASDKELIVMCLERLENIETLLNQHGEQKPQHMSGLVVGEDGTLGVSQSGESQKETVTRTPTTSDTSVTSATTRLTPSKNINAKK